MHPRPPGGLNQSRLQGASHRHQDGGWVHASLQRLHQWQHRTVAQGLFDEEQHIARFGRQLLTHGSSRIADGQQALRQMRRLRIKLAQPDRQQIGVGAMGSGNQQSPTLKLLMDLAGEGPQLPGIRLDAMGGHVDK
jgi:phosphoketolase